MSWHRPDLANRHNIDGITVLKRLREKSKTLGIIMLSAKSQEMDKVNALMNEADDYITKPFAPSELTVRVDALYRRVIMNSMKTASANTAVSAATTARLQATHMTATAVPYAEQNDLMQTRCSLHTE